VKKSEKRQFLKIHQPSKRSLKIFLGALCGMVLVCVVIFAALNAAGGHFSFKPPLKHTSAYVIPPGSRYPEPLTALGNQLVTSQGKPIHLAGLMPPDPETLERKGRFNPALFAEIHALGANAVRIPVFPEDWANDSDYLWRYLDPVVTWAGENDLYILIDWHYIGNMATGEGPKMPRLKTSANDLTLAFWRQTTAYFRSTPHVIFEIYNEPQAIGAEVWQSKANEVVQAIRQQGASQLIIVGGIEYGKDLSWTLENPIPDANIAYASHIYPAHPQSAWRAYFGQAAEKYPVLITEWGYIPEAKDTENAYLVGTAATYGEPLLNMLDQTQTGWIACWYDDEWLPAMLSAASQERYSEYGRFVIRRLQKKP
jgi:endoglucanase